MLPVIAALVDEPVEVLTVVERVVLEVVDEEVAGLVLVREAVVEEVCVVTFLHKKSTLLHDTPKNLLLRSQYR